MRETEAALSGWKGSGDNAGAFLGRWSRCSCSMRSSRPPLGVLSRRSSPGSWPSAWCSSSRSRARPLPKGPRWTSACSIFLRLTGSSYRHRAVRLGQFQQRLSHPANAGYRRVPAETIAIYAGYNLVAAADFLSGGLAVRQMGRQECVALCYVIFLIAYLGFALTQNIVLIAGLFYSYGIYQGIFRTAGKWSRKLRAGAIAGERHRLVQHHRRHLAARCQFDRGRVVGSGRPRRPSSITARFCRGRDRRVARADAGQGRSRDRS